MVNRVGGLASGMDIDALVEKLMTAERVPLNKLNQKKTTYEWQRDAYRAVNTKLKTFSDYLFDNFSLSSNFAKKTSTVTGVNSGKITVNAGSGASGTLDIQAVKQLATAAKTDIATANKTSHRYATETDSLDDINVTPGTITLNVTTKAADGKLTTTQKDITIEAGDSIKDFVDKLKSAGLDTSSYDPSTGKFKISGKDTSFTIDDQQSAEKLKSFGFSTSTTVEGLKVTNDEGKEVAASKTTDLNTLNISQGIYNFKVGDKNVSIEVKAGDTIESLLTELNKEEMVLKLLIMKQLEIYPFQLVNLEKQLQPQIQMHLKC